MERASASLAASLLTPRLLQSTTTGVLSKERCAPTVRARLIILCFHIYKTLQLPRLDVALSLVPLGRIQWLMEGLAGLARKTYERSAALTAWL